MMLLMMLSSWDEMWRLFPRPSSAVASNNMALYLKFGKSEFAIFNSGSQQE
jgi:hypothetical protein